MALTAHRKQFSVTQCCSECVICIFFFLQNLEAKSSGVSTFRVPVCNCAHKCLFFDYMYLEGFCFVIIAIKVHSVHEPV